MFPGSFTGMAKRLRILHQTLPSRRSPPPLRTKTQPALPSLHPTMFPKPSHPQTRSHHFPLPTRHPSPPTELGAGAYTEIDRQGTSGFGELAVDLEYS